MSFSEQTAVITGAARGIGLAIARELAARGCRVVVSDLDQARSAAAAADIEREFGVACLGLACEVREREANQALARRTMEAFGRIDVWVNNAGVLKDDLLLRMSAEDFDSVMDVNLKGAFLGTQAAARYMLKARRGRIVNIGSVSGFYGNAGQANYSASKAGLFALTKTAARELAGRNVTVNCVAAGFVENDMTAHLTDEQRGALRDMILLKPSREPAFYIAKAAAFLASADADFITGAILRVDGGMLIGF